MLDVIDLNIEFNDHDMAETLAVSHLTRSLQSLGHLVLDLVKKRTKGGNFNAR